MRRTYYSNNFYLAFLGIWKLPVKHSCWIFKIIVLPPYTVDFTVTKPCPMGNAIVVTPKPSRILSPEPQSHPAEEADKWAGCPGAICSQHHKAGGGRRGTPKDNVSWQH